MAKSQKRRKKPAAPSFKNKGQAIKNLMSRTKELCKMVNCNAMKNISILGILLLAKARTRIGNVHEIISEYNHDGQKSAFTEAIKSFCKSRSIQIKNVPEMVSVIDLTIIDALKSVIKNAPDLFGRHAQKYKKELDVYFETTADFERLIDLQLARLVMMTNFPNQALISIYHKINIKNIYRDNYWAELDFTVKIKRPQHEYISINRQRRPVYKVCIPYTNDAGHYDTHLKSTELKHLYKGSKKELPIYIQSHALMRIKERLKPISQFIISEYLHTCLIKNLEPYHLTSTDILIPFHLFVFKLGYFVAEVIDEKVVIKTFIFITHANSPEGRKFQELTGFNKVDMNYWDITKLDTFINNEMEEDNPMFPYFKESGLLYLFVLSKKMLMSEDILPRDAHWDDIAQCLQKYNQMETLSDEELKEVDVSQLFSG